MSASLTKGVTFKISLPASLKPKLALVLAVVITSDLVTQWNTCFAVRMWLHHKNITKLWVIEFLCAPPPQI